MGEKSENATVSISSITTWNLSKDGHQIQLAPEDLLHLLSRMTLAGDLIVFDEGNRRCCSGDDITVCLNGSAVQITVAEG